MSCVDFSPRAEERVASESGCSWQAIVRAIRSNAERQPPERARDLRGWADLLDGIAQLNGD